MMLKQIKNHFVIRMADSRANSLQDQELKITRWLRMGYAARAEGNRQLAHHYWRKVAMKQPDLLEIWEALLTVVESDADRKTCLQNILAIEPQHQDARRMLNHLVGDPIPAPQRIIPDVMPRDSTPQPPREPLWKNALRLLIGVLIGSIIAFVLLQTGLVALFQ